MNSPDDSVGSDEHPESNAVTMISRMKNTIMIEEWIKKFQLFLFDFDGLLVNTEELHYLAYKQMCRSHGIDLNWSFERYCAFAHYHSAGFKEAIFSSFPDLEKKQPDWDILYEEKKQALKKLFLENEISLMPGVETFLKTLEKQKVTSVVVTHSPKILVDIVRSKIPLLNTISHWMTREDYIHPKPDPECYIIAVKKYLKPGGMAIGFEDTPRGLRALMPTGALSVLISETNYPEIPSFLASGAYHYRTFHDLISLGSGM